MLKRHSDLLDLLLDIVKNDYTDDISVMFIYGSCVSGTAHEKSDIDMIFIPKTERGKQFSKTFILDGVGYDVWCMDWERLEGIAHFDEMIVSVLADSKLVYSSADEDRQRYESLKNTAKTIANGPLDFGLLKKAQNHLNVAKQYLGELCLDMDLTAVGGILMEVCNTICLLNHSYLRFGIKRIMEELSTLQRLPPNFISAYTALLEETDTAENRCAVLIKMTERLLLDMETELQSSAPDFSGLYEEISSHWNKIRVSCASGDTLTAFLSAASLQQELDYVQRCLRVSIPELSFFSKFDSHDLGGFVLKADKAEIAFQALLQNKGIPVMCYIDLDELRKSFSS